MQHNKPESIESREWERREHKNSLSFLSENKKYYMLNVVDQRRNIFLCRRRYFSCRRYLNTSRSLSFRRIQSGVENSFQNILSKKFENISKSDQIITNDSYNFLQSREVFLHDYFSSSCFLFVCGYLKIFANNFFNRSINKKVKNNENHR